MLVDMVYAENTQRPVSESDGVRIAWEYSSMQCIAPGGGYGRVRRLNDGSVVAVYDRHGNVEKISSYDDGRSWSEPQILFRAHTSYNENGDSVRVNTTNAEIYQLTNGVLIAGCNYRPAQPDIAPYAIAVSLSSDMGETWSEPRVLYEAGTNFSDGCWEPAFLQLPSGELQVYFANEGPYTTNADQEISVITSSDGGETWSAPRMVCFREGHRDGMPVPQVIGEEIVLSIEDNRDGELQPYILRTPLADNWKSPVLGDGPQREPAHLHPLSADIYAGAPYTLILPSGETLISYQTTEGRRPQWELSTLEVAVGDSTMRHFTRATRPFDVPTDRSALWNSLALWNPNTVVAVATTGFREPHGIWMIKGHVLPARMSANQEKVRVDGYVTPREWGQELPILVGAKGPTQARAAVGTKGRILYFGAIVFGNGCPLSEDGLTFYLAAENDPNGDRKMPALRVWCPTEGEPRLSKLENGQWIDLDMGNVRVACNVDPEGRGYGVECGIPFDLIGVYEGNTLVRVGLGLSAMDESNEQYEELLVNTIADNPDTWYPVELQ